MATKLTPLSPEQIAAKKAALPSNRVVNARASTNQAGAYRPPNAQIGGAAANATTTPYQRAISGNAGQATPLPQQEREDARQAWIDSQGGQGSISTMSELDAMRNAGTITQDQYDASKYQISSGLKVNPLGFAAQGQRDQAGNIILQSGTKEQYTGQTIQDQRAPVGATFSDPRSGAMGQAGSTGFNQGQLTPEEEAQVQRFASGEGYASAPTPAEVQDLRNSIVQSKINAEQAMQTQQAGERTRANASAISTAAAQRTTPSGTVSPQGAARLDSIGTMLDGIVTASGDPMGAVYKQMMMQEYSDKIAAEENARLSYGASVGQANKTYNDTTNLLDRFTQIHQQENDKYTNLLKETKDSQQKFLAEQNQRDQDYLSWQSDAETQKLERAKTKQLLQANIQNALGGGSFSGAANENIASTEREWDTAIANLGKEYDFKKTDVSAMYTQKYIDTNNQFKMDIYNASKELNDRIESYSVQGFNSLQARDAAITQAGNDKRKALDEAAKNYTTALNGHIKSIGEIIKIEKQDKAEREQELYDREWDAFKFEQEQLYKYDALEQTKLLREDSRIASEEARNEATRTRRDDKERYNSQLVMDKLSSKMEANKVFDQYKDARMSYDALITAFSEDSNPFRDRAMAKSYEKLVEVGSVVMPGEYADIVSNIPLASLIEGKFKKVVTGGQAWTDKERVALRDIGKSLFEAYEKRRNEESQIFLSAIQFHNQNTENDSYKLSPSMFNLPEQTTSMQRGTFESLLPNGYTSPFSNPNGGGGSTVIPKENGKISTGFISGVVTGYGSKYWGAGLDVSAPKNTPITTPLSGVIEKVVYDPSWEGTPNNSEVGKSQNGGFGNQVVVKYPDGVKMQFSHASNIPITEDMVGKNIDAGSTIAYVGNTGNTYGATGIHADITGYKKDGSTMTAEEVAEWLINNSQNS